MGQCKVNNKDVFIDTLQDVCEYMREFVGDDFADIAENIIFKEISEVEGAKADVLSELEDAQDEIDSLEEQLGSVEEELDEANRTISELQYETK